MRRSRREHNIPDDLILNWDQTGVKMVLASEWTMASCGSKQVAMIGLDNKREVTALLCITLSGVLLPPQIVYKGKTDVFSSVLVSVHTTLSQCCLGVTGSV